MRKKSYRNLRKIVSCDQDTVTSNKLISAVLIQKLKPFLCNDLYFRFCLIKVGYYLKVIFNPVKLIEIKKIENVVWSKMLVNIFIQHAYVILSIVTRMLSKSQIGFALPSIVTGILVSLVKSCLLQHTSRTTVVD